MHPARSHVPLVIAVALGISLLYSFWGKFADVPTTDCVTCDAGWYQRIAEEGYRAPTDGADLGHWHGTDIHQTEWAFFPLYPWAVRVTAQLTGLRIADSMLLLGALFSALLALLALRFFSLLKGEVAAFWGVMAILLQPFGIYFHLGMTEALFLSALLGSFLSIAKRSPAGLAFCATALVLTRPNGLFLLPVLMFYVMEVDSSRIDDLWRRPLHWVKRLWPLVFPVIAFVAYGVFQWKRTGDPFAFSSAQAGWDRSFTWPFVGFFNGGDIATQFDSWYALALLALAFTVRKKLPLSFNLLIAISILLPLFSGSVASMPRFSSILFPLFLLAGSTLAHSRWRVPALVAAFLLQLCWFHLWSHGELITC